MNINTTKLVNITEHQLYWVNRYVSTIEYDEELVSLKLVGIAGSKAIKFHVQYSASSYTYCIDLDGVALKMGERG